MDVVVRTYSGKGSTELFSLLEKHKADVETRLRQVKGFESYTLARSNDGEGGVTITICQDKAGTEESVQVARAWIAANGAHIQAEAPKIVSGTVIIHAVRT